MLEHGRREWARCRETRAGRQRWRTTPSWKKTSDHAQAEHSKDDRQECTTRGQGQRLASWDLSHLLAVQTGSSLPSTPTAEGPRMTWDKRWITMVDTSGCLDIWSGSVVIRVWCYVLGGQDGVNKGTRTPATSTDYGDKSSDDEKYASDCLTSCFAQSATARDDPRRAMQRDSSTSTEYNEDSTAGEDSVLQNGCNVI